MRWWMPVLGAFVFMILAALNAVMGFLVLSDEMPLFASAIIGDHKVVALALTLVAALLSVAAMTVCIYLVNGSLEIKNRRLVWNHDGYA